MRFGRAIGVIALAAASLSDCLDPTEIEIVVSTDVPCGSIASTAIAIGPNGDDSRPVSAVTPACSDDGGIGTLIVTPSHGLDDSVGIRVMLGENPVGGDQCKPPGFEGCIVARRQLRYDPHHPLTLPVELQQACLDHPCDPNSTCFDGQCVDAGAPSCDEAGTCVLDAGAPCGVAATLVVPIATPVTPHLVQTNDGYAVGYDNLPVTDPARMYDVTYFDPSGAKLGDVVLSQTALDPSTHAGALGTDGTNFAGTYVFGNILFLIAVDRNGTQLQSIGQSENSSPYLPPREGVHYEDSLPGFAVFSVAPLTALLFARSLTSGAFDSVGFSAPGMSDPALVFADGVYYGIMHDPAASTCWIYAFFHDANGFALKSATGTSIASCTTVRYAEDAPGVALYATRSPTGELSVSPTPSPGTTVGSADDQAVVALPAGGTAFHVVWRSGTTIHVATVDTATATTTSSVLVSGTGFDGDGNGFDAIADPSGPGYEVAYWSSTPTPGIYFARNCQ
jgi:hypothetical protein